MNDPTTYEELKAVLNGHRLAELAPNTHVLHDIEPDVLVVTLYGNVILKFHPTGEIRPSTAGWDTHTTVNRLNRFTPARFTFRRKAYDGVLVSDYNGPAVHLDKVAFLDPSEPLGEGIYERTDQ